MSSYGGYVVETFVTLLAVCALAVAVLWGARRIGVGRPVGPMELLGRLPLDARRSICLVRVGARVFVVGVGDGTFTKLGEIGADALSPLEPGTSGKDFGQRLGRVLRRKEGDE